MTCDVWRVTCDVLRVADYEIILRARGHPHDREGARGCGARVRGDGGGGGGGGDDNDDNDDNDTYDDNDDDDDDDDGVNYDDDDDDDNDDDDDDTNWQVRGDAWRTLGDRFFGAKLLCEQ